MRNPNRNKVKLWCDKYSKIYIHILWTDVVKWYVIFKLKDQRSVAWIHFKNKFRKYSKSLDAIVIYERTEERSIPGDFLRSLIIWRRLFKIKIRRNHIGTWLESFLRGYAVLRCFWFVSRCQNQITTQCTYVKMKRQIKQNVKILLNHWKNKVENISDVFVHGIQYNNNALKIDFVVVGKQKKKSYVARRGLAIKFSNVQHGYKGG